MPEILNESIDSMLENLETDLERVPFHSNHVPITLWIPIEYKEKYEMLQARTNRRFGKRLKEIFKKAIDNVKLQAG